MGFDQKLVLTQKDKFSKLIIGDQEIFQSYEELAAHFEYIYKGNINLSTISDLDKKLDLVSYLQQFLLRILHKAAKILPFENKTLRLIHTVFPNSFNKECMILLGEMYDNIIEEGDFSIFYGEVGSFSSNIQILQKHYDQGRET
jgi:hypothetical protein